MRVGALMAGLVETSFTARDGYVLGGEWHVPAAEPWACCVLAPAMGVPRQFYRRFAAWLADAGIVCATFDYRGVAGSRPQLLRGFAADLTTWADLDLTDVIAAAKARYPSLRCCFIGHSVGAQLFGLLPNPAVDAAVFVAGQSGHWRHWQGGSRALMWLLWHMIPVLVPIVGYLPMRALGQGENVPRGAAEQWARWGRARDYVMSEAGSRPKAAFFTFDRPILSYAMADDAYAPRRSVEALASFYARASVEVRVVEAHERLGHFGFFRPELGEARWNEVLRWLRTRWA